MGEDIAMKRFVLALAALGGVAVAQPAFADQRGVATAAFEPGDSAAVRADNQVLAALRDGLDRDPRLHGSQITVSNQNGLVTLVGSVPSVIARSQAIEIARTTPGVTTVKDNLRLLVSSPEAPVPS
jgi:hyperosmotically inducible protein